MWKNNEVKKCQKEEKPEMWSWRGKETVMQDIRVTTTVWCTINGHTIKFMKYNAKQKIWKRLFRSDEKGKHLARKTISFMHSMLQNI